MLVACATAGMSALVAVLGLAVGYLCGQLLLQDGG